MHRFNWLLYTALLTISLPTFASDNCTVVGSAILTKFEKKIKSRLVSKQFGRVKLTENQSFDVCSDDRIIVARNEEVRLMYKGQEDDLTINGFQSYQVKEPFGTWQYLSSLVAPKLSKDNASFSSKEMATRNDEKKISINGIDIDQKNFLLLNNQERYELSLKNVSYPVTAIIQSASGNTIEKEITESELFILQFKNDHPFQSYDISLVDYAQKSVSFSVSYQGISGSMEELPTDKQKQICEYMKNHTLWLLLHTVKCSNENT
ncbi:hypothetical protein [Thalassotalea litorea]|uniref:hypothetical protein n=1 Tax=Thalassotalea litorea TaxID=2020715 RepID=UPI003735BF50